MNISYQEATTALGKDTMNAPKIEEFATRADAEQAIVNVIEATGEVKDAREEYNIAAILDSSFTWDPMKRAFVWAQKEPHHFWIDVVNNSRT